ncbi:MAG: cyclic nucleotide-binding domain-containing protein [Iphinoe sp. HA4291-MV1]|jgi:ATP-binding cassette subfamily B protein|nr:cyclic nucleotide-binding domain-containing protein [Iphinoe sp. HA4291-MV1]
MNLRWEELPFCLLTPEQQMELKNQAKTGHYQTGNIIWSTDEPGSQFLIISGNVRFREDGKPQSLATLKSGDWFGDLLEFSGQFKAVAKDSVEVVS